MGVADPDTDQASRQLKAREGAMYKDAKIYPDYTALLKEQTLDAVWIAVPPNVHGTGEPGKDIELRAVAAGVHMFVEKPISSAKQEDVQPVASAVAASGLVTSVGYMFRYAEPINRMKEILRDTPGGARAFVGNYNCAYSEIRKHDWWDVRMSGGPIVEQATHFVDLARYLVGDADVATVKGVSIAGAGPAGDLADVPVDSEGKPYGADVPPEFKHPRATAAVWEFMNGGIGSLTHGTLLHREKYETGLEIWGDGLRMVLVDPYGECCLQIRRPHSEEVEEVSFADDDPYLAEDQAFVTAVRTGDTSGIRSSYGDAMRTYELTWAITEAARSAK
jgi:predicted dehydrogenase